MNTIRLMIITILLLTGAVAEAKRYPYQSCFEVAASMHNVPVDLLLAVAATESNWQPGARSQANAHGVMQIQWPGTARHLGVKRVSELYNPCLNIALGAQYLAELLVRFDNSTERALAAYNYGPTRIERSSRLPDGARKYVDTVRRHQEDIVEGTLPKRLRAAGTLTLTAFDSKRRAQKVAYHLSQQLSGATVAVQRSSQGRQYDVVLHIGSGGLTPGDHLLLQTLGLKV